MKNEIDINKILSPENYEDIPQNIMPIKEQLDRIEVKLDRILAYIDKVESPTYRANEDAKQMVMNIISDLFSNNRLENNNFNRQ